MAHLYLYGHGRQKSFYHIEQELFLKRNLKLFFRLMWQNSCYVIGLFFFFFFNRFMSYRYKCAIRKDKTRIMVVSQVDY